MDRWSSPYTWNNSPPPVEGDFVVIGDAQKVMLDQDTPVMVMVLVNGGTLFFDPTKNVELKAKYIVIINNGTFQVRPVCLCLVVATSEQYVKEASYTSFLLNVS